MVGVAGKSKGCNTCRKRKVKCDVGGIPCGPCRRSRKTCTGYQRDRTFKNLSSLDHDSLLSRSQPLIPNTEPSFLRYEQGYASHYTYSDILDQEEFEAQTTFPLSNDRIFACFMTEYMPLQLKNSPGDIQTPLSWMQIIPHLKRTHTSLDNALAALSMVRLGRKYNDQRLRKRGTALYGQALEGMQKALTDEASVCQDQTLASCLTMAVFEASMLLEVPGHEVRGWTSHVRGLSKLFRLRGPAQYASGPSHSLFLGFRATEIIHALATRRSTYLARQEWLYEPWISQPKSHFHHLLDIMAKISIVIQEVQSLGLDYGAPNTVYEVLKQSHGLEIDLRQWHREYLRKSEAPPFVKQKSFQNTEGIIWLEETVHFVDFEVARMHLFYWAALLLIYMNMNVASQIISKNNIQQQRIPSTATYSMPPSPSGQLWYAEFLANLSGHRPSISSLKLDLKMLEIATLILESIPYLLSEDAHILGPQNAFFPLRIAQHTFSLLQGRELEENLCRNVFRELAKRGYAFGKILSETGWDEISILLSGEGFTDLGMNYTSIKDQAPSFKVIPLGIRNVNLGFTCDD